MNIKEAHQHFSCECFNETWSLLELSERTPEEVRKMIASSHASLYHWLNREDCTPENLSIGLWQLARVYVVADSPLEALKNAKDCLEISKSNSLSSFCMAYAHEAVCRAALLGKDVETARRHLEFAKTHAAIVSEEHDKKLIDSDLRELEKNIA